MGTLRQPTLSKPVLLTAEHDCSAFSCEHPELTAWLREKGLRNQSRGGSRTLVCCDENNQVVGYYAIAPGAVQQAVATGAIRRNMPDPIPVLVLGRLAVHEKWVGCGVGRGLLKDALLRCAEGARIVGGRAILCHAIDEKAKAFYLKHGFHESPVEPLTVMLGIEGIAKLI
jgi:GNAT superfamily N-acetyltransferase